MNNQPDISSNFQKLLDENQRKYLADISSDKYLDHDLVLDQESYFIITINSNDRIINVEQFCGNTASKTYSIFFQDRTAKSLCQTIFYFNQLNIKISTAHAAYLGRELMKAELVILLDQKYIQD